MCLRGKNNQKLPKRIIFWMSAESQLFSRERIRGFDIFMAGPRGWFLSRVVIGLFRYNKSFDWLFIEAGASPRLVCAWEKPFASGEILLLCLNTFWFWPSTPALFWISEDWKKASVLQLELKPLLLPVKFNKKPVGWFRSFFALIFQAYMDSFRRYDSTITSPETW